jgi:cytochrome c oxidase accessory protein FixG
LFRPIERWLEGSRGQQQKLDREGANVRRVIKYGIYALLALLLGNLFLSYFVGVEQLSAWLSRSPFEHPAPFLVMLVTAGLVFFDFTYFREQMCTIICPYARLQSVLLDKRSLVVGYDRARGEPRGSRKREGTGDCIDCKACVVACPTGIDIRDGLQLECVACAQCVDACDGVMAKLGKPPGLVRYASQAELEQQPSATSAEARGFRVRTLLYPALMVGLLAALIIIGSSTAGSKVTVLRGTGAPFVVEPDGRVRNQIRVKIHNRENVPRHFHIALEGAPGSELVAAENPLLVASLEMATTSVFVESPRELFSAGRRSVELIVESEGGFRSVTTYNLMGPR